MHRSDEITQVALGARTTGVAIATDLRDGVIDRFRSLPITRIGVLAGQTTIDLARNAMAVAMMIAAGFAIGFRLEGGLGVGLAALAVALLFGYALTWVFAAVGLAVRDPQTATFIGFAPVLVFVYVSSAWVPIKSMNGAVQGFVRHQPVNVTIEAVCSLANATHATGATLQHSPGPRPSPSSRGDRRTSVPYRYILKGAGQQHIFSDGP